MNFFQYIPKKLKKHSTLVLLIAIVVLGVVIRSGMFVHGDFFLLPDQGRDLMLAKDILMNHKLTLIGGHTGIGGLFHGPLWWYAIIPFFVIFKGNPFLSLIPLWLLVNVSIIVATFFLGKVIHSNRLGLILAFLTCISSAFVDTVTSTSNSQVMPAIFAVFLIFLIKYLNGNKKSIIICAFLIGLGIHFESALAIFLLPSTIILLAILKKLPDLRTFIYSTIAFVLIISNFVLFDLRHKFLLTSTIFNLFLKPSPIHTNMLDRIVDRLTWIAYSFTSALVNENRIVQLFSLALLTFFVAVFIKRRMKKRIMERVERIFTVLLLFLLIIMGTYMLCPILLTSHYIQSLSIIPLSLLSISILYIYQKYKAGRFLTIIYFSLVMIFPILYLEANYTNISGYVPFSNGNYLNQLKAVDLVFKDSKGVKFAYLVYDPPVVTYAFDYLMWWRGKYTYGYIPDSYKKPITYLIMEPYPPGDLNSHNFWIKYTVRTKGKVIGSWTTPGNIKILKLQVPPDDPPVDPNYYISLTFR